MLDNNSIVIVIETFFYFLGRGGGWGVGWGGRGVTQFVDLAVYNIRSIKYYHAASDHSRFYLVVCSAPNYKCVMFEVFGTN